MTKIIKAFLLLINVVNLHLLYSVGYGEGKFEFFQETIKKELVENKISEYLQHDSEIENHYLIDSDAFYMFANKGDKLSKKPEITLRFGSKQKPASTKFIPNKSSKPLSGLRVAIDPGHMGGEMAFVEERFIDMVLPGNELAKTRLQFAEGTLATFTAKILKQYLTAAGAEVLLTREEPGQPVYSISFYDWCAQRFGICNDKDWADEQKLQVAADYLGKSLPAVSRCINENPEQRLRSIHEANDPKKRVDLMQSALLRLHYNMLDLKARAEKINAFHPDITIVIHFNASGGSHDISSNNYNLIFIPGSFLKNELSDEVSRREFVRLIVTDDLENSLTLSKAIAEKMESNLEVPLMNSSLYQAGSTIFVDSGIYCRNLALTRLVHGPLCYGETFIQNNPEEAKRLAQKDLDFGGTKTSSRLAEVALAYFEGICQYLKVEDSDLVIL